MDEMIKLTYKNIKKESPFNIFFIFFNSEKSFTYKKGAVLSGDGVSSQKELASSRYLDQALYREANEVNFRINSYNELSKIQSAFNLTKNFNFSHFSKIGDIGGVPFHQALVIADVYPHLSFLLTDFDIESCIALKSLSAFSNFQICEFNAKNYDYSLFESSDLLTMWGVDPSLSDKDLISLFYYIKNSNKVLLIASIDIETNIIFYYPIYRIGKIIYQFFRNIYRSFTRKGEHFIRAHALLRNSNYFLKLAKKSGLKLELIQVDNPKKMGRGYRIYKLSRA